MANKTLILYDLKNKTTAEKTSIQRRLYNYRDNSNYAYSYGREGALSNLKIEKSKKTVLRIKNKKDVSKVVELLNELKIRFEIAKS